MKKTIVRSSIPFGLVMSLYALTTCLPFQANAAEDARRVQCPMQSAQQEPRAMQRVGSLANLTLSNFIPALGEAGPDVALFGTPYLDTWIDAFVHTDKGEYYWVVRSDRQGEPKEERMAVFSSARQNGIYMDPERFYGETDLKLEATGALKLIARDGQGEATLSDKTAVWKQEGLFELKGRIAGPGMQAVFPTIRDGKAAHQVYHNRQYLVEGTVRGQPAKGFILFERNYETQTWPESVWGSGYGGYMYFGNEFDDGSVEMGYVYCGGDLHGAIVFNGKGEQLVNTGRVGIQNNVTDEGVLTGATYSVGDSHQWKFEMDPAGKTAIKRMGVPGLTVDRGFSAMAIGYVTRVGERRKRVRGWALANAGRTY